jgi:ABC-type multidrug transport system ATPase subunit
MPDAGAIYYDDKEFTRDDIELRRRMFFLPDFPFVFAEMTVLQHVGMSLKLFGVSRPGVEELTVQLLKDLDLLPLAERPMLAMSRGQFYKAALCAMIAVDPEVWMLDEPFASGMDPQGISVFKERAREAAQRGRTILYSTQILDVAERFSDRVCILDGGEVKAFGKISELESMTTGKGLEQVFRALREVQ